jgi:hypothetical protein
MQNRLNGHFATPSNPKMKTFLETHGRNGIIIKSLEQVTFQKEKELRKKEEEWIWKMVPMLNQKMIIHDEIQQLSPDQRRAVIQRALAKNEELELLQTNNDAKLERHSNCDFEALKKHRIEQKRIAFANAKLPTNVQTFLADILQSLRLNHWDYNEQVDINDAQCVIDYCLKMNQTIREDIIKIVKPRFRSSQTTPFNYRSCCVLISNTFSKFLHIHVKFTRIILKKVRGKHYCATRICLIP